MSIQFKKAIQDLCTSPKRTLTVVFALLLGIWGVGTVVISYAILTRDLQANYLQTLPAQATFRSEDFSRLDEKSLAHLPEVEVAEFRDFSLHRIEVRPNVWIPLWLYGIEDFNNIKLAKIFHQEGLPIPAKGTVWMERDGRHVSYLGTDSVANVRIENQSIKLAISGICFDPGQAPATQDAFIYAYTDTQTYQQITRQPIRNRLIVRFSNVHSTQEVERKAEQLTSFFQKKGIRIQAVNIPKFNEHPHQWQLNTLLFLIGTIGLLAFLMGAVLVSQLMRSILISQIRQIGVMKAIGASRKQIFRMYILMLLLIGALAGILAIPLASASGQAFAAFVAGKLNFDILTTSVPWSIYGYLLAASLLLPVLLSLATVWKGTRTSVQEALTDYGISEQYSFSGNHFLSRWNLPDSLVLASRNALRNKRRLAVTILTMALGVAIFDTGFNVRQSLWNLLQAQKDELNYDIQVALNKPTTRKEALAPFQNLANLKNIEVWVGGRGEIQSKVVANSNGAGIVAVPWKTQRLRLKMIQGRWIQQNTDTEIVLNQQAWALYNHPQLGDRLTLTIGDKTVNVKLVGIAEQFDKAKVYMDIEQYDALANPSHAVNTLVVVAKNNSFPEVMALKKEMEKSIAASNLDVAYVMSQAERVYIIYAHLNIILYTIVILSFLVLTVSAVGMASATGINIWERTREIGIMRAIGATPAQIYRLFVWEGLLVSMVSIILGLLLSYPLSQVAAVFFGDLMLGKNSVLEYAFSPLGFVVTLVTTLVFGWLASRIPARGAIRISTREALAYE